MITLAAFGTTVSGTLEKTIGNFGTAPAAALEVEAASRKLVGMLVVVLADAEDVPFRNRDRRLERDAVERIRRKGRRKRALRGE